MCGMSISRYRTITSTCSVHSVPAAFFVPVGNHPIGVMNTVSGTRVRELMERILLGGRPRRTRMWVSYL